MISHQHTPSGRSNSPRVSPARAGARAGAGKEGEEEGEEEEEEEERRGRSRRMQKLLLHHFSPQQGGTSLPSSIRNLFIPPTDRHHAILIPGITGNHNDGVSGGSISPYNPASIAKSLTTRVNQRHLLYAKTARGVLLNGQQPGRSSWECQWWLPYLQRKGGEEVNFFGDKR